MKVCRGLKIHAIHEVWNDVKIIMKKYNTEVEYILSDMKVISIPTNQWIDNYDNVAKHFWWTSSMVLKQGFFYKKVSFLV